MTARDVSHRQPSVICVQIKGFTYFGRLCTLVWPWGVAVELGAVAGAAPQRGSPPPRASSASGVRSPEPLPRRHVSRSSRARSGQCHFTSLVNTRPHIYIPWLIQKNVHRAHALNRGRLLNPNDRSSVGGYKRYYSSTYIMFTLAPPPPATVRGERALAARGKLAVH